MNLAGAKMWLAHHHTQALAAGGAGVVGFALYRRHQNTAGASSSSGTPVAGQTPSAALGYGDPGAASPTFSDPTAALLDADLSGIQSTLDGIRSTLGKINPANRGKTKPPRKTKRPHQPKPARRVKTSHKGAPKKTTKKDPHKPPTTSHEQHQRTKHAARERWRPVPSRASATPARSITSNPRPAGQARPATPVAHAVPARRTLAAPGPRPAPTARPAPAARPPAPAPARRR